MPDVPSVPPALTAEQWAEVDRRGASDRLLWTVSDRHDALCWLGYPPHPYEWTDADAVRFYAALIALANDARRDDDPGKIVAADVEVCRQLAEDDGAPGDARREALGRVAAKLAALLPPAS
jgi:hypothetical protein